MPLRLVIVTLATGASQTIHTGTNSDARIAVDSGPKINELSHTRNTTFTMNR